MSSFGRHGVKLAQLGVHCDVVAPTLLPTKPGDRVKTDRGAR